MIFFEFNAVGYMFTLIYTIKNELSFIYLHPFCVCHCLIVASIDHTMYSKNLIIKAMRNIQHVVKVRGESEKGLSSALIYI